MTALASLALVTLCLMAVWFDVRERRIPNPLALGTLLAGLAWRMPLGLEAIGSGVLAVVLAFVFGFGFYLLGGLGAGDVKFMAGAAAFVGTEGLLLGLLVMALTGGAMAVVASARKGVLGRTFRNLILVGVTMGRESFRGWKGEGPTARILAASEQPVRNPYGIAIALGALAGWFGPNLGFSL